MNIALDIMGGDFAPDTTMKGAVLARAELPPDSVLTLIGDEAVIQTKLSELGASTKGIQIVHAPDIIGMGDHPTKAIAQKPNSSISVGFRMLKSGKIDAFAGTGNTGAMMVGGMYTVKAIMGVIRPAIICALPQISGKFNFILDVGSNADCRPDVLYQFGILGNLYARYVFKIDNPRVALLNIGEEEKKGNLVCQAAYEMMNGSKEFNFTGNIEGRDLFTDKCDVVVCEGFVGNVVLKQAEAFYTLIRKRKIKDEFFDRFNYEIYGGMPIIGLNSTVVIGHGISNETAIKNMILLAGNIAGSGFIGKIREVFQ
ncbi:MAG: phosphate acyltransferase PlsX [Bacteroidetes bacterium]|nr:phosphate acyltransferase PlsX [Bacteroidota bacterium]